jgi:sugar phosphate isomerase/epimerase
MNYNRKQFLQLTGGVASGFALTGLAGKNLLSFMDEDAKKIRSFGLQLWTIREDLAKDPKAVLKQVASYGYKQIESFEGKMGIFWGMTHLEFKKYMDELGMSIISSHCDITKDFEKKAADAAAIGMKYLIYPYEGPKQTLDDYKKHADDFNKKGEICKKNGIRFAFHNHNFSFEAIDGQFPQDIMMKNTDASLVDFEMDIYWVVATGQDPIEWFKKYPGRFKLCHVKDRSKTPGTDNGKNSIDLGAGSIDFSKILKSASKLGLQYYIVEQEFYPIGTPLESVKVDAEYMKRLKI